jgi:hypothetical protein
LPLRLSIGKRFGGASKIYELVVCYWCSGWWVSALTTGYTLITLAAIGQIPWIALLSYPLLFPAVAYAASWILDKEVESELAMAFRAKKVIEPPAVDDGQA